MSLIALAADKGSPGVTTTTLALAAVWPRPVIAAELDPSGGDLAVRCRRPDGSVLSAEIGLLSLAAALRRGARPRLRQHVQNVGAGVAVLQAPLSAEQYVGFTALWRPLAETLASDPGESDGVDGDVLADLGRLLPDSPTLEIARRANLVVLVARPRADSVVHLRERVAALAPVVGTRLAVAVVSPPRHAAAAERGVREVLDAQRLPVGHVGVVAADPAAVGLLEAGEVGRRLDASMLLRTARTLAADTVALLLTGTAPADPYLPAMPVGWTS